MPEKLKEIYRKLRGRILGCCFTLFGHLPIKQKRVVFENVWGYGDNPKSIALALRRLDRGLEIVFIAGGKKKLLYGDTSDPKNGNRAIKALKDIKFVSAGSIRAVYYLATARVWVDCNHKPYYVRKRSGQFYMQTWHGSLPLKRIEADASGLSEEYLEEASYDTGLADVFLSNSEFCNDVYRHAFGYKGRIAVTGSPRLDRMLRKSRHRRQNEVYKEADNRKSAGEDRRTGADNWKSAEEERRTKILKRIGIDPGKGVVLYAPTFRGGGEDAGPLGAFDGKEVVRALGERFGKDFVLCVKLHPLAISHGCNAGGMGVDIKDVSSYHDIYELLEAADVLITDYSNTMFEFSYTGKPCFLFAPDSERYAKERGMYFVYDKLPFPIARDSKGLADAVKAYDSELYTARAQSFYRELGVREDGRASQRAARIIISEIFGRS